MTIYLINLDRSTDRLAKFHERNSHLHDVERFSAFNGRTLDKERLVRDGIVTSKCATYYNDGELGCAMSHITLWRKAAEEQRAITVAEDDTIFSRYFAERSQEFLAAIPEDWDFIQWGWIFSRFLWIDVIPHIAGAKMVFDLGELSRNIGEFQNASTRPAALRLRHCFGTQCYSVTPKGAQALLSHCLPLDVRLIAFPRTDVKIHTVGIDCAMNAAYPKLNAFVCMPPMVATVSKKEESTIRGQDT